MADKQPSSGLLKLEEQLTCPVCLDLYTNPKTLPCLHSFCQECLEGLAQKREARGDTYYLSCPTCRQHTEVPREGVGALYRRVCTPVRTIASELKMPCSVAVSDDSHVIVAENSGNRVKILDNEGKKVKSFGGEGGSSNVMFSCPRGVAITPDNFILVSDNHRIHKISMDGYYVLSVGMKDSRLQQFNTPAGIAISPITGKVYIADSGNHRIQVLNPDLTFSHSFGKEGSANGQFNNPWDIAIDSQGLVYVADTDNHRIQKFTPNEKFMAQFGSNDSGPGQLNRPHGIAIDTTGTGQVYVSAHGNHCVSVFTSNGVFVNSFGQYGGNFDYYPIGLSFDKKGLLYVCDYYNNRLVIY